MYQHKMSKNKFIHKRIQILKSKLTNKGNSV